MGRPQRFSEEQIDAWLKDYEAGVSIPVIARRYQTTLPTVYRHLRRLGSIPSRQVRKDKVVAAYLDGCTVQQAADLVGVCRETVSRYLKEEGIQRRLPVRPLNPKQEARKDKAVAAYQAGATLQPIAEKEGVSAERIRQWLVERGVERRPGGSPYHSPEAVSQWVSEYQAGSMVKQIAQRHKVDPATVSNHLKDCGVEVRRYIQQPRIPETAVDEWVEQYQAGDSLTTIAKRYGVGTMSVHRWLRMRGVQIRPPGTG